jgi:hypothetical protein
MELDLTIRASQLRSPSRPIADVGIGPADSQLGFQDPGRCAVSVTNVCDTTTVWDCTAPWVCG